MKSTYFREGCAIRDQFATHFLTFTICGWIDLFTRKVYRDIVMNSFRFAQKNDQLILNAFVIMSNPIHLIGRANDKQRKTLSDIIRDFKKYTHHQMWPIIESDAESRRQWMVHQFNYYYTHENPVRAGIVEKVEDYIYSIASNYAGRGGIIDVELL